MYVSMSVCMPVRLTMSPSFGLELFGQDLMQLWINAKITNSILNPLGKAKAPTCHSRNPKPEAPKPLNPKPIAALQAAHPGFRAQLAGGNAEALDTRAEPLGCHEKPTWDFPKTRVPYFGILIIRILLFGEILTCAH